ncbi:hypothetical protein DI44_10785 [Geobacillus sp. CAMR5420]|nr:hypothetical protein DI44_10785 [Geobacillus sp. CAMR5420]
MLIYSKGRRVLGKEVKNKTHFWPVAFFKWNGLKMHQDKIIYKIEYYFLQIKRRSNSSEDTIKVWDKYR